METLAVILLLAIMVAGLFLLGYMVGSMVFGDCKDPKEGGMLIEDDDSILDNPFMNFAFWFIFWM